MSRYFIDHPIVAQVLAILTVIAGAVMILRLPIAQFPEIAPPQIQTTATYTSTESSAEWIEEAPSGPGGILPLDNFNSVSFTAASATQGSNSVDVREAGAKPITMLNANNQPLAIPSPIGSDGASFSVTRTSVPTTAAVRQPRHRIRY